MRNLGHVIDFLLSDVIPTDQTVLRRELTRLGEKIMYSPPEMQGPDWNVLSEVLGQYAFPIDTPWKIRTQKIVNDEEKLPEKYRQG